jgi:hypothetical protein
LRKEIWQIVGSNHCKSINDGRNKHEGRINNGADYTVGGVHGTGDSLTLERIERRNCGRICGSVIRWICDVNGSQRDVLNPCSAK